MRAAVICAGPMADVGSIAKRLVSVAHEGGLTLAACGYIKTKLVAPSGSTPVSVVPLIDSADAEKDAVIMAPRQSMYICLPIKFAFRTEAMSTWL